MEYAVELLQKERETVVEALKMGERERLRDLQQIDKAIGWLRLIQANNLDKACKYNLDALPYIEGYGGFACYRVMIDKETEDTEDTEEWEEYEKRDGKHYLLSPGDFLLVRK